LVFKLCSHTFFSSFFGFFSYLLPLKRSLADHFPSYALPLCLLFWPFTLAGQAWACADMDGLPVDYTASPLASLSRIPFPEFSLFFCPFVFPHCGFSDASLTPQASFFLPPFSFRSRIRFDTLINSPSSPTFVLAVSPSRKSHSRLE